MTNVQVKCTWHETDTCKMLQHIQNQRNEFRFEWFLPKRFCHWACSLLENKAKPEEAFGWYLVGLENLDMKPLSLPNSGGVLDFSHWLLEAKQLSGSSSKNSCTRPHFAQTWPWNCGRESDATTKTTPGQGMPAMPQIHRHGSSPQLQGAAAFRAGGLLQAIAVQS